MKRVGQPFNPEDWQCYHKVTFTFSVSTQTGESQDRCARVAALQPDLVTFLTISHVIFFSRKLRARQKNLPSLSLTLPPSVSGMFCFLLPLGNVPSHRARLEASLRALVVLLGPGPTSQGGAKIENQEVKHSASPAHLPWWAVGCAWCETLH